MTPSSTLPEEGYFQFNEILTKEGFVQLLPLFVTEAKDMQKEIQSLQQVEAEKIGLLAHRMAGTAASFGAMSLATMGRKTQTFAVSGSQDEFLAALEAFLDELEKAIGIADQLCDEEDTQSFTLT